MQIVIDIPDEYKELFENDRCKRKFDSLATNEFGYVLRNAFKNGILLPKGHGRLIDADALKEETYTMTEWNGDVHQIIYKASLDDALTIVEPYKEET